jgi:ABC-type transport system involved in cytochrome c biogenesis permease subunit
MQNTEIVPSSSAERTSALFIGLGLIAAQGFYFLFYAQLIAQSANVSFRGMNTLWLTIHIDFFWTSYLLYLISLALAVYLYLKHATTRFPWIEVATMAASVFAVLGLIAGIIFSKPAWGVYWVFDAKHVIVLIAIPVLIGMSVVAMGSRALLGPKPRSIVLIALLTIAVLLCAGSFMAGFFRNMHPQWLVEILLRR